MIGLSRHVIAALKQTLMFVTCAGLLAVAAIAVSGLLGTPSTARSAGNFADVQGSSNGKTRATNLVLTLPSSVSSGDIMIAVVALDGRASITAPGGWTLVIDTDHVTAGRIRTAIYYRFHDGSESNPTFTLGASKKSSGAITAYSGIDTTTPLDGVTTGSANALADGSGNIVAPTITTNTNGAIVVAVVSQQVSTEFTTPAGMTERIDIKAVDGTWGQNSSLAIDDVTLSTAGASGTKTSVGAASTEAIAQIFALKPAPTPGVTIVETSGTSVNESGTTDSFTVVLDEQPATDAVLTVVTGDTGEATVSPATLTFTNGNWNSTQTVTVTGIDDSSIDGSQTTTLTIAVDDASSDDTYDSVADQTVSATTVDNDTFEFSIVESGGTSVNESGTTDSFTVVLTGQPATDVVFSVVSGDTGEATVSPASLTFTNANWSSAQTVTVTGVSDGSLVDGSQTTSITLSVIDGSSDDEFDSLADQTVTVTTIDNSTSLPPEVVEPVAEPPAVIDEPATTNATDGTDSLLSRVVAATDRLGDTTLTEFNATDEIATIFTQLADEGVVESVIRAILAEVSGDATVANVVLTTDDPFALSNSAAAAQGEIGEWRNALRKTHG
jgi:hypothetical protein